MSRRRADHAAPADVRRGRVQRPDRLHPARARLPPDQQQDRSQPVRRPGRHRGRRPVRGGDARRQADRDRPPVVPPVVLQRHHRRRVHQRAGAGVDQPARHEHGSAPGRRSRHQPEVGARDVHQRGDRRRARLDRPGQDRAPATAWPSGTTPAPRCRSRSDLPTQRRRRHRARRPQLHDLRPAAGDVLRRGRSHAAEHASVEGHRPRARLVGRRQRRAAATIRSCADVTLVPRQLRRPVLLVRGRPAARSAFGRASTSAPATPPPRSRQGHGHGRRHDATAHL